MPTLFASEKDAPLAPAARPPGLGGLSGPGAEAPRPRRSQRTRDGGAPASAVSAFSTVSVAAPAPAATVTAIFDEAAVIGCFLMASPHDSTRAIFQSIPSHASPRPINTHTHTHTHTHTL